MVLFIRCGFHSGVQTQVTKILDDIGGTIGYEFRPHYTVTEFGTPDVLLINYSLQEGKVSAFIRKIHQSEDPYGGMVTTGTP